MHVCVCALSADLTMLRLLLHGGVTCQLLCLPFLQQPVTQMSLSLGLRENAGTFVTVQVQQRAQRAAARQHAKQPKYGRLVINPIDCANTEGRKMCCTGENPRACFQEK